VAEALLDPEISNIQMSESVISPKIKENLKNLVNCTLFFIPFEFYIQILFILFLEKNHGR